MELAEKVCWDDGPGGRAGSGERRYGLEARDPSTVRSEEESAGIHQFELIPGGLREHNANDDAEPAGNFVSGQGLPPPPGPREHNANDDAEPAGNFVPPPPGPREHNANDDVPLVPTGHTHEGVDQMFKRN